MTRVIETVITLKDGEMKLETMGAIGDECQTLHQPFLDAMGIKPGQYEEQLNPEYHQQAPELEQEREQEGGGSFGG